MKRLITFVCLIVIIILGFSLVKKGFENETFNIASYETIETKSEALTKKLASYDKKNQEEYETAVTNLNSSIKTYKDAKVKYEAIVEELSDVLNKDSEEEVNEVIEEIIYSDKEKYKVDFLLVTLGDYGEKEGVDVVYQLTTSSTTDPNSTTLNYFLADLKFSVTGQYMDVANFISDLENDEKLKWEISNFAMGSGTSNGYSGVSATFTIKDVPIDSESYLESAATQNNGTQDPNATGDGTQNPAETTNTDPNATTDQTTTNDASMVNDPNKDAPNTMDTTGSNNSSMSVPNGSVTPDVNGNSTNAGLNNTVR